MAPVFSAKKSEREPTYLFLTIALREAGTNYCFDFVDKEMNPNWIVHVAHVV